MNNPIKIPPKKRKLVIFGTEDFADIAYEYFTWDSDYEVVAFTLDRNYLNDTVKRGIPVLAFDELKNIFPPGEVDVFVAVVYGRMNRFRAETCCRAKELGYNLASYVSSRAFVWHNVRIGEHCFIFEDNTVQPFVKIEDDVILWSGNHIGHHSHIGNHCFLTSHVVVSGWVKIGDYCFIGVNSTIANNSEIGAETWVGHGACVTGNIPPHSLVKPIQSEVKQLNEDALFRSLARISKNRSSSFS
jgi:sugar O-acyltransferase (sialic acid O-acetyltransferase NeuD family)